MKLRSQKGFTLIEGLLSIIAIALIVFVGYYVYNTQHKANTTLDTATKENTQASTSKAVASVNYFVLPDLGIKIKKTDNIKDFSFKTDPTVPQTRYVYSQRFDTAIVKCYGSSSATTGTFFAISRIAGQYTNDQTDSAGFPVPPPIKQFDSFFIDGSPPNGVTACQDPSYQSEFESIHKTLTDELIAAVQSAQKL